MPYQNPTQMAAFIVSLLTVLLLNAGAAQEQLPDEKRAVMAFDIRLESFRRSEFFQKTGANRQVVAILDELHYSPVWDIFQDFEENVDLNLLGEAIYAIEDLHLGNANRISGAISAPSSIEKLASAVSSDPYRGLIVEGYSDGPKASAEKSKQFPFEFFLQIRYENGFVMEFGSEFYVKDKSRDFYSENLARIMGKLPNSDIRIVLDVDGARTFADELVAIMQSEADRPWGALSTMLSDSSAIGLAMDADSDHLLTLYAETKDAAAAKNIEKGLNVLIPTILGDGVRGLLAKVFANDSDQTKDWNDLVASIKPHRKDNVVSINVVRSDSFESFLVAGLGRIFSINERENRFKEIGLGIHNYYDTFKRLPISPGAQISKEISWRVLILPFIEYVPMYEQLVPEKPWNDEINKKVVDQMPITFGDDGKNANACWIIPQQSPKSFADLKDGTAHTVAVIEVPDGVPWMEPNDLSLDEAVKLVTGLEDGQRLIALYYDGHVGVLSNRIPAETLRKLFDPDDGQEIDWDEVDK